MIKVASTWEGLQACRKLTTLGIRTLATTVFTMEQAVLAAEAGCDSISPFVHEIKIYFDETYGPPFSYRTPEYKNSLAERKTRYHDTDPIMGLCAEAQRYYQQHYYPTKVKACSAISLDEVLQLAGVAAFTIPPDLLRELAATPYSEGEMYGKSLFNQKAADVKAMPKQSFIDDEAKYRLAFTRRSEGKGYAGTIQVRNSPISAALGPLFEFLFTLVCG